MKYFIIIIIAFKILGIISSIIKLHKNEKVEEFNPLIAKLDMAIDFLLIFWGINLLLVGDYNG